jgi:hypothetical protein
MNQRELICKWFGHRWRDTSSLQMKHVDGKWTNKWELARTCQRCGKFEITGYESWKEKGVTKR